jgi:hypothetical protein
MSLGRFQRFGHSQAGTWFLSPESNDAAFITVHFTDAMKAIRLTSSDAQLVSFEPNDGVYVPDGVDVYPDARSISEINLAPGNLVLNQRGPYLHYRCDTHSDGGFVNIHTGNLAQSVAPAIWFQEWTLYQKSPGGYVPLLQFGVK